MMLFFEEERIIPKTETELKQAVKEAKVGLAKAKGKLRVRKARQELERALAELGASQGNGHPNSSKAPRSMLPARKRSGQR